MESLVLSDNQTQRAPRNPQSNVFVRNLLSSPPSVRFKFIIFKNNKIKDLSSEMLTLSMEKWLVKMVELAEMAQLTFLFRKTTISAFIDN